MDVTKQLGILFGGAVFIIPVLTAPNAYLQRVGPKPLSFNAPPPSRDEVLRLLPPLATGLPPKETPEDGRTARNPLSAQFDPATLLPVPADPAMSTPWAEFPRIPDDWIEALLGPPRWGSESPLDAGYGTPGSDPTYRPSLRPEDLVPFFISPAQQAPDPQGEPNPQGDQAPQRGPTYIVPVPFIPGVPSTPNSSRANFNQE